MSRREARRKSQGGPWLDWPNYWAAGDATSLAPARLLSNAKVIGPNVHGINAALYELELQRIELIEFNLFENNKTYKAYVTGRNGVAGPVLNTTILESPVAVPASIR